MDANREVQEFFKKRDIRILGFADLSPVPAMSRENYPRGIVFGIPYSAAGMMQNREGDPQKCYDEYYELNSRMDTVSEELAQLLVGLGYKARPKEYWSVVADDDLRSVLPHKTVATLAGLGWIGKCALLVSEEFGSAFRMSVVLTNAPLACGTPVEDSKCPASCTTCRDVCPGKAPSGKVWARGLDRALFFDAHACNAAAHARSRELLGKDESICALCMSNCPFTRRAIGY